MPDIPKDQPCPHCGRFANRGLTIDALIIREGKILLGQRGAEPFKGYWATPGGYVEWNETAEQATIREVKEETGLTVTSLKLLGVYSKPERHPHQAVDIAYVAEVEGEALAGDDLMRLEWFALDGLPELAFDHAQIISDHLTRTK